MSKATGWSAFTDFIIIINQRVWSPSSSNLQTDFTTSRTEFHIMVESGVYHRIRARRPTVTCAINQMNADYPSALYLCGGFGIHVHVHVHVHIHNYVDCWRLVIATCSVVNSYCCTSTSSLHRYIFVPIWVTASFHTRSHYYCGYCVTLDNVNFHRLVFLGRLKQSFVFPHLLSNQNKIVYSLKGCMYVARP